MIYIAEELLKKLTHLALSGQNEDGELEFIGTDRQWKLTQPSQYANN